MPEKCPACDAGYLINHRGKLTCDWCRTLNEGCCEGEPVAWATLKCDHKHPSGGKVSAGTTLEIAREFESHDEQGAHQSMALKDESGRVVLTCVDREDGVLLGIEVIR